MPHHVSTLTLFCTDTDALLHVHPPVQVASVVTPLQDAEPAVSAASGVTGDVRVVPQVFALASQVQPPSQVACVVAEIHKVWSDLPPVHFAVRVASKWALLPEKTDSLVANSAIPWLRSVLAVGQPLKLTATAAVVGQSVLSPQADPLHKQAPVQSV